MTDAKKCERLGCENADEGRGWCGPCWVEWPPDSGSWHEWAKKNPRGVESPTNAAPPAPSAVPASPPTNVYRKPCGFPVLDHYRVCEIFGVTDSCLAHAAKKVLFAGKRRGGKTAEQDVAEAIEALKRWQEMRAEEKALR